MPGCTCDRGWIDRCGKSLFSLGFADPVTDRTNRCIYAYAPDVDKGLLTPSCLHPHMETRSGLLHGRAHRLLDPYHLPVSPASNPSFLFLSTCSISRSQRILKTLQPGIFSALRPRHFLAGDIIQCTSDVCLNERAFQFASDIPTPPRALSFFAR